MLLHVCLGLQEGCLDNCKADSRLDVPSEDGKLEEVSLQHGVVLVNALINLLSLLLVLDKADVECAGGEVVHAYDVF